MIASSSRISPLPVTTPSGTIAIASLTTSTLGRVRVAATRSTAGSACTRTGSRAEGVRGDRVGHLISQPPVVSPLERPLKPLKAGEAEGQHLVEQVEPEKPAEGLDPQRAPVQRALEGRYGRSGLGTSHGAERWKRSRRSTRGAISGTNWIAVAPVPNADALAGEVVRVVPPRGVEEPPAELADSGDRRVGGPAELPGRGDQDAGLDRVGAVGFDPPLARLGVEPRRRHLGGEPNRSPSRYLSTHRSR